MPTRGQATLFLCEGGPSTAAFRRPVTFVIERVR